MKRKMNVSLLLQAAVFLLMFLTETAMLLCKPVYERLGEHTMYFYNSLFFIPLAVLAIGIFSVYQTARGNLEMAAPAVQCLGAGWSVYVCYTILTRISDIEEVAGFYLYVKGYVFSLLASLLLGYGLKIYAKWKIRRAEW